MDEKEIVIMLEEWFNTHHPKPAENVIHYSTFDDWAGQRVTFEEILDKIDNGNRTVYKTIR